MHLPVSEILKRKTRNVERKPSTKYILYNKKARKSRFKFCFYGLFKFSFKLECFSFQFCGSNSSSFKCYGLECDE